MFQALRMIFTDYMSKLTPLKRFDKNKLKINHLLERVSKVNWQTAELSDLISIASELIMVGIVTSPHILLKPSDYCGIAVMKMTPLLQCEPTFSVDRTSIRFLDSYSFLDEQFDLSVLDAYQQNCLTLYNNLEFSNKIQLFCKEAKQSDEHFVCTILI